MFWGAFTYDHKGPCHIWEPENAQQKKAAAAEIEALNAAREPAAKLQWEVETAEAAARKLNLRGRSGGRKPTWKFTEKRGKCLFWLEKALFVASSRLCGGVDVGWNDYDRRRRRYQKFRTEKRFSSAGDVNVVPLPPLANDFDCISTSSFTLF